MKVLHSVGPFPENSFVKLRISREIFSASEPW